MASCSSSKYVVPKRGDAYISNHSRETKSFNRKDIKKMIDYASNYKGVRYQYGGSTPQGFDCSGYVQYVFKKFDYVLPRTTSAQSNAGKNISKNKLQPGDLVFFKGSRSSDVGHVGIVVEIYKDNSFKFIHASTSRGVVEEYSTTPYYAQRYLRARRIFSD